MLDGDQEYGGNAATQDAPDEVVEHLRELGAADDLIDRVQKERMLHSDYTRKRQQESAEVQRLQQQVAYLGGVLQSQQKQAAVDPIQEFLDANDDGSPESKRARGVLEELARRVKSVTLSEVQQLVNPIAQQQGEASWDKQLREHYAERLVPKYGAEVRKLITPELHRAMVGELVKGGKVHPESVLFDMFPDEMVGLRASAQEAKNKSKQSRHTEGMVTSRTNVHPFSSKGGKPATARPNRAPDTYTEFTDVLRKIGLK